MFYCNNFVAHLLGLCIHFQGHTPNSMYIKCILDTEILHSKVHVSLCNLGTELFQGS